jgi:NAD(P)-dependent dehydrogenase (short-subunit alcohol dehydrogenase family)
LSKQLLEEAKNRGIHVNCIDMDDFVIDTKMRRSARKVWVNKDNQEKKWEYTTSCKESYYLAAPESIIYSLEQ